MKNTFKDMCIENTNFFEQLEKETLDLQIIEKSLDLADISHCIDITGDLTIKKL